MSLFQYFTPKKSKMAPLSISNVENAHLPSLSSEFQNSNIKVVPVPEHITMGKQFATVFENVLSPSECESWINASESAGYGIALVNVGYGVQKQIDDYRNSSRCIIDSVPAATQLWERIKHLLPTSIKSYIPVGINERLRFLKYETNEYFAPHYDACYKRPAEHTQIGDISYYTIMLYLNQEEQDFTGGSTRFNCSSNQPYDVQPKTGSVLIFEHNMEHSGEIVITGQKYAMRSDIMCVKQ